MGRVLLRLGAFAAVGVLSFVGCSVDSSTELAGDSQLEDGAASLTMDLDGSVAHAVRLDASRVRVDIYDRAGTPQFSADFRVPQGQTPTVEWTYLHPATADAPAPEATTGSMEVELEQLPSLEGAITGAAVIQAQVSRVISGEEYDNWGCDLLPGQYNWIVSCGTKGACCDVHDACFATYGCTAGSWTNPGSEPWQCSVLCNASAVACFTALNPGPSACCWRGNCGEPR
ncbi:hypothetical protein WMF31_40805 [Sorangium sp. So ce1036]|uniref:hypothetical protein n=1 Tax=Sorangium sp. So ce1036 TaxID=3133328 RepID=UPI003F05B422